MISNSGETAKRTRSRSAEPRWRVVGTRGFVPGRIYRRSPHGPAGWPSMSTAEIAAPLPSRYRDAFAVAEFGPLFTAYVLSLVGDVVAAVALTVLVFQRTGSPFLAGLTF